MASELEYTDPITVHVGRQRFKVDADGTVYRLPSGAVVKGGKQKAAALRIARNTRALRTSALRREAGQRKKWF